MIDGYPSDISPPGSILPGKSFIIRQNIFNIPVISLTDKEIRLIKQLYHYLNINEILCIIGYHRKKFELKSFSLKLGSQCP